LPRTLDSVRFGRRFLAQSAISRDALIDILTQKRRVGSRKIAKTDAKSARDVGKINPIGAIVFFDVSAKTARLAAVVPV